VDNLDGRIKDAELALELLETEEDKSLENELSQNLMAIQVELDDFEEDIILSDKYDSYPAVMTLHPGAGGTESHDWAEMLLRMYKKWMENKRFKYRIIDYLPGEEAGIKSVTLTVNMHMVCLRVKKGCTGL